MKESLYDRIGELLKTKEEYRSEDGELLKAKVYSDIMTMDKNLLSLLLSDEEVKKTFFLKVDDALVFDKQKFAWIIDSKEFLPDSYTAYTNKIGLTSDGDFISKRNDVVLDFPYKDCVLEGGQTKDDQNRKEIFYNETLAQDEIRRMLDPKVFTNAKRYTKDGVEENISFDDDDNLIIKGNNLIALTSLLKRYEGKVKCIYIDPPYNTGSDSFNYNDNFNHSAWLTFMKNRLKFAKKLMSENSAIFVQCNDKEQAYLKVLMDEIFGRDNFLNVITIKMSEATSNKMAHANKILPKIKEYVLFYKKGDISINVDNILIPIDEWGVNYKTVISGINDDEINKLREYLKLENANNNDVKKFNEIAKNIKLKSLNEYVENWDKLNDEEKLEWKYSNAHRIIRIASSSSAKKILDKVKKEMNQDYFGIKTSRNKIYFVTKNYNEETKDPNIKFLFAADYLMKNPCDFWSDIKTTRVDIEGNTEFTNGKKPEKLIKRIISMITEEKDIILDFFLGSGTTSAVSHKMNRQYIGIEQMENQVELTIGRLCEVLKGDKTGISEVVDWQGGGSFVYCELLENGNELIRQIKNADENRIKDVKAKIYRDERIVPYITTEELEKADKDFEELNLKEKKKVLIKIVDKNKLYVNYSDIDSGDFDISEADKKFTKSFYEVD